MKSFHFKIFVLISLTIFFLSSSAFISTLPIHPISTEDAIIQALTATIQELGENVPIDSGLNETGSKYWRFTTNNESAGTFNEIVLVSDMGSESYAKEKMAGYISSAGEIDFHGYQASHYNFTYYHMVYVRLGQYLWMAEAHFDYSTLSEMELAEMFYRNAVASGFMTDDGSVGNVEPFPTDTNTPTITTTSGSDIVLQASLAGQGANTLTLPNTSNFGVIDITGMVTDQDGKGISGATVEVISGAAATSTKTNSDGRYALTLTIPSGQNNTTSNGVNFMLQAGDLSINRIVILQAIEGGRLVTSRDVGVRVFLNWGIDQPADVEVTLTMDNQTLPAVHGVVKKDYTQPDRNLGKDAINIVIPKDQFPSYGASNHSLTATVTLLSPDLVDVVPDNNTSPVQNFSLQDTRALSILYVSLDPSIGKTELVNFAATAHNYLDKVYPISYSWGFVGTQQTSYYLVSPYVGFMKSLDADDLPLNLGDIGIVEGGLEVGKSFSYKSAIIAVEKARRLYNTQRCKDANGNLVLPCPDEVALQAVGVYPDGAFGASKDGFAYVDHSTEWRAAANSIAKPNNVAHELGHLFGFGEEYSSTSFGIPVTGSTWDGLKFQTADGSCVNIMGNVGLTCAWINAQTWNKLLDNPLLTDSQETYKTASILPINYQALPAEVQSPALLVEGIVTSEGNGHLNQVSSLDRYTPAENPNGQFRLEAKDDNGIILAEIRFDGLFFDLDTNPISVSPFMVDLPVDTPNQVTEIVLQTSDGQVIDTFERSPASPDVRFDPLPAQIETQTTISWQATDPDSPTLFSTLYYSNNNGISWQILGMDLPVSNFTLNPSELPGGEALFKVSVSDGFNSTETFSSPIILPNQPPIITIISPWGTEFEDQALVTVEATTYDLEEGLIPAGDIEWFDFQGTLIGIGSRLQTKILDVGTQQIYVQAQDATGKTSRSSITITINENSTQTSLPISIKPNTILYLLLGGGCVFLSGIVTLGSVFIFTRRKKKNRIPNNFGQNNVLQDHQGNWWSQDQITENWSYWNGQTWQVVTGTSPNISQAKQTPSLWISMILAGFFGLLAVGGVVLVGLNFIPKYQLPIGQGDTTNILTMGGGGLLAIILGAVLLYQGIRAVITRQVISEDEWGRQRKKRGCSAILSGLAQTLFGILFWSAGLVLITITVFQEVLPLLGF